MKKVLFKIYLGLDFIILLSSVIFFFLFLYSYISSIVLLIFFISVGFYISINSIVGIIWLKKNKNFNDSIISNNWLLPIYIINTLSIFCLFFPIGQAFDYLFKKDCNTFFLCFSISLIIILSILGQVKWQKMLLLNQNLSRFIKYFICILNPVKCFFIVLVLQGFTLPC